MAAKTKAQLKADTIQDLKDSCSTAGVLDVDKFVNWTNDLAATLARRAQKKIQNSQQDIGSFLTAKKTEFEAHRAAEEAKRVADGDLEE